MEENIPKQAAEPMPAPEKTKKKSPVLTIIFAILALAGIGFGVYGMCFNKPAGKECIESEVAKKTESEEQQSNKDTANDDKKIEDEKLAYDVNMDGGPYVRDGYFYVPDWKLKFKIPEELTGIGYSVDLSGEDIAIGFSGYLKKDSPEYAQELFYDRIDTCAILSVMKKNEQGGDMEGALAGGGIKQFDGYRLYMWGYEARNSCDIKLNIDETKATIREMFSNPESI